MKYLVAIFLLSIAMGISAEEEGCLAKKAEGCIDTMIVSIIADNGEDLSNTCGELKTVIDCLQEALNECGDDEANAENVIKGIKEFENTLKENCEVSEDDETADEPVEEPAAAGPVEEPAAAGPVEEPAAAEGTAKCMSENEEYIYECIGDEIADAIKLVKEEDPEEGDENALQCGMYALMSACMIDRVGEKCGEAAAQAIEEDLSDPPQAIKDACEASESIVIQAFELLSEEEDKRKKK